MAGFVNAQASSVLKKDNEANYAIDEKISTDDINFFQSQTEDYPWLQLEIYEGYVTSVTIVPRHDCCAENLESIEIRAGLESVEDGYKGRLTINTKVAFFSGPATTGHNYTIYFNNVVHAKFITLQRIKENVNLEINELTYSRVKASPSIGDWYLPEYAVDGKISNDDFYFYHSSRQNYPWFEVETLERYVAGVIIVPRTSCCAERFRNIEIRAGMSSVAYRSTGNLTINTRVAFFTGPATTSQNYTINFDQTVLAKYITLQRMEENCRLEINEVILF